MKMDKVLIILSALAIYIIGAASWKMAEVQADAWNRCHPTHQVTQAEVFWSSSVYRITECNSE